MNRKSVVVLGCGRNGEKVIRELVQSNAFSSLLIADIDVEKARKLATELAESKIEVSAARVDVEDEQSLLQVMKDLDVVVNMTGPYDRTGVKPVKVAIKAKINYIDIDDTIGPTQEVMALDEAAKAAGVTALIGFGAVPGMVNFLVRYGVDKLDEVNEIHIALGGTLPRLSLPSTGHIWRDVYSDPALIYKEGQLVEVPAGDKEMIQLPGVPRAVEVMPIKLPPIITIPRFIPGVKLVTIKSGENVFRTLHDLGLGSLEPIDVKGTSIVPSDFAVAFLASEVYAKALGLIEVTEVPPVRERWVRVVGEKDGRAATYTYLYRDPRAVMCESTCALGAQMLVQGDIKLKGVIAPEALDPEPFIRRALERGTIIQEFREQML